jgi:hypothetical protein
MRFSPWLDKARCRDNRKLGYEFLINPAPFELQVALLVKERGLALVGIADIH